MAFRAARTSFAFPSDIPRVLCMDMRAPAITQMRSPLKAVKGIRQGDRFTPPPLLAARRGLWPRLWPREDAFSRMLYTVVIFIPRGRSVSERFTLPATCLRGLLLLLRRPSSIARPLARACARVRARSRECLFGALPRLYSSRVSELVTFSRPTASLQSQPLPWMGFYCVLFWAISLAQRLWSVRHGGAQIGF